jgi:hypothetical protein
MIMTPDQLPSKPAQDAKFAPTLRDAPVKGSRDATASATPLRDSLPAKAGPEELSKANDAKPSSQKGGGDPSHRSDQVRSQYHPEPGGEQYVRLTVRVEDDQMSIVDSHLVAGPLAETTVFQAGFAYEVVAGDRRLHAGSIPDLGTFRSFVNAKGKGAQRGHHTYQLSTYEFEARVPLAQLRDVDLSKVAVALYRVKQADHVGAVPVMLSRRSLAAQREQQFREMGRVEGMPDWALPSGFAPSARQTRPTAQKVRDDKGGYTDDDHDDTKAD